MESKTNATRTKAARAKSPHPKSYTSTQDVYVGGEYTKAGQVFVTDEPASEDWTEVSPKEAAAITASTERVPDDANLEAADTSALQAVAIMRHVPIAGIAKDSKALLNAIKASYEPKL
jgi:hypothetical protein